MLLSGSDYKPNKLIRSHFNRSLPEKTSAIVCCWDIDKTYIDTHFENLRELIKIPLEKATDKKDIPGAVLLLRGIKHINQNESENTIYFVSASPHQLRSVLEEKMKLDRIDFTGTIFKNQLYNVRKGKFNRLNKQLAYKLSALLQTKRTWKFQGATELLFGDSHESDIVVYNLYRDIVRGQITFNRFLQILQFNNLITEEISYLNQLFHDIQNQKSAIVDNSADIRSFILLVNNVSEEEISVMRKFPSCFLIHNYFEASLILYADGLLDIKTVLECAKVVFTNTEEGKNQLIQSIIFVYKYYAINPVTAYRLKRLLVKDKQCNNFTLVLNFGLIVGWIRAKYQQIFAKSQFDLYTSLGRDNRRHRE